MKKLITSSGTLLSCLIAMAMMLGVQSARAQYVPLTYLDGMLSWGQYGLGSETYDKLVDQDINTKWGGWFDPSLTDEGSWPNNEGASANKMYIIVKAKTPVVPSYYFLVTGNDTKNSNGKPDRNWLEWKIYGGNFADDTLAVREGEGWTLVEHHTADDEALPNDNFAPKNFACSENVTTAFQYFWIEIISTVAQSETYQQMGEFGFGTYAQFQSYLANKPKPDTDIDEPLVLYVLEGTSMSGNEGLPYLFDGKTTTKWCTGFTGRQEGETTNGAYFIVQCSRTIVPSYYVLTTANDTERWSGRNWKQWQIYGMNAESLDEVKRNSTEWVAIDKKYNVGTDQLPAANYTPAYFVPSEPNTTGYKFFKVEIDQIVSGGTMQMSEFSLGDQYQFEYDRESIKTNAQAKYDPDLFAEKALLDRVPGLIAAVEVCTDPVDLANLSKTIDKLFNDIEASVKNYAELITTRNQIALAIDANNIDATAIAYLTTWMSETDAVAPSAAYPCGNYAYIVANRHITGDEAAAEVKRINAYMLNHSTVEVVPITAKYKFISGTTDNWKLTEGPEYLIDGQSGLNGTSSTKWGTGTSGDRFIIFKSINAETGEDEAIQPTYYGLVTGGDTQTYTDRNWKNWKIWGANFTADSLATKNSSDWVLIDVKENVGTDILKTTNCFESYIYLSIGCAEPYTHFKIEVYHSGGMQMNEFTFYNTGNMMDYRDGYVSEFADYDSRKYPAFKDHILAYESKYEELQTTVYAPDVMKFKNELTDLQKTLNDSRDLYAEYDSLYTELSGLSFDSESMSTWWNSYSDDYIAPSNKFIRGSHNYIVGLVNEEETNLGMLNDDEIQEEFDYIQWIYNAVDNSNDCHYILLGGHTVGQFGDGFYGHLIDGIAKDWKDASGTHKGTKWGGNADENGNTYIIFRTQDKTNPFFYTLTTGNDAHDYYTRNWGSWRIYGANFEGDGDATKDAAWELIDEKLDVKQDRLHAENETASYFGFSTETEQEYMYYKVEVLKAYSGTQIQMNELYFGTPEEFSDIKDEYTTAARSFDYQIIAQQSLIDEYVATIPEIDDCMNMEALFRVNYKLETLRDGITSSAALYTELGDKVVENLNYVDESHLTASDALTIFLNYLNGDENQGPSDLYPNGSPAYIINQHVQNDSVLRAELAFMEELRVAAVAAGYGKGLDITCLIVNPTFAKASDMLKDDAGNNIGREAEGWNGYIYRTAKAKGNIYAAEFCNANRTFDVNQTLSNLKNGFYKVTLNAGYRANGSHSGTNGKGSEPMISYNYAPMAYANEIATYIPVVREDAAPDSASSWQGSTPDKMIYSYPDSADTFGLGIWGCEGAAHAFGQGRYAITMVAKVTDGTLTIGVKNEGTTNPDNSLEWTAAGNFGLVYLGEAETEAADALAEAADYNAARITTLTETYIESFATGGENGGPVDSYAPDSIYVLYPNFAEAEKAALIENSGKTTYAAQKQIGEIMQSILATKKAYIALKQAVDKVYDHWCDFVIDYDNFEKAIYGAKEGIDGGTIANAEAALALKAQLYTAYPDYLMKVNSSKIKTEAAEGDDDFVFQEEFTFNIVTTGKNPYIDLANLYEPLEKDETILAFDYTAEQDIESGKMSYLAPEWDPIPEEILATIPAATEWTTAYVNVAKGIKDRSFGTEIDHGIRWNISGSVSAQDVLKLKARNFRFISKAQMKAAGGKPLNGTEGDVNNDGDVNLSDALTILDKMAEGSDDPTYDVNGDGKVNLSDFLTVLDIMAEQK